MTKMRKQTSKSLPCKQGRKQRKFKPFDKEFQPIVMIFCLWENGKCDKFGVI